MKTKTLYISDLDGTLLTPDGFLSEKSCQILNEVIRDRGKFTIATSRNLNAFLARTKGLAFRIPVILNSGACIYDLKTKHYKFVTPIPLHALISLKQKLEENRIGGFIYALKDEQLWLIYERYYDDCDYTYLEKRKLLYPSIVMTSEQLLSEKDEFTPIFFVAYGSYEKIQSVRQIGSTLSDIRGTMSHDVYSNNYFIEFTEGSISKASAIQKLKNSLDVDEIVAFGDNTNDIEMLTQAGRSYVPANGISDVKALATKIIGSNSEDSVAQFIKKDFYS